ncbi:MAG: hypothetical protein ACRCUW_13655, partial [Plesiomonas shigelloides]
MRSFLLAVLSAITLALACAEGERETVKLKCFGAKARSVDWYWYEGTSRAGVLHPARAITKEGSLSIPGVSGYEVDDAKYSLTIKFDRCDVTLDLQCSYLDWENARRRYMFKVGGCVAYVADMLRSRALRDRDRTERVDAEEFTFRCFEDEAKRPPGAPPASWYWNREEDAHARRPSGRGDPAPEGVRAHGSHNGLLTIRLNSCDVTLDIKCLAHDSRDYSEWTHF